MFEACLTLPQNPREARLVADVLERVARALREWPRDAWQKLAAERPASSAGLFERLVARVAPLALVPGERDAALASAEATAAVLRCLWPEGSASPALASEPERRTVVRR
jgi:hypothetical protein